MLVYQRIYKRTADEIVVDRFFGLGDRAVSAMGRHVHDKVADWGRCTVPLLQTKATLSIHI